MSVTRMCTVTCDECRVQADNSEWTADEARYQARKDGWHRSKNRDLCPDCWDGGVR